MPGKEEAPADPGIARSRAVGTGALVVIFLLAGSGSGKAEHLACPACEQESRCVPGQVAGRVVCAGAEEIVEHESVTAYCLSCHQARRPVEGEDVAEVEPAPPMTRFHPMEVEYPRKSRTHRPVGEVYQGIRLTNGKVTCLSCHSGQDRLRHYLPTHPREPNLCLHCHLK